jgi:hypothetical protein
MSRPLRRVRASAGQLAERALSLPIRDSHRKDEVGQIVAALTTLWQDQWTARAQAKAATLRAGAFQRAANPMMLLDNAYNITESNDAMRDFLEQNLWEIRAGSPDFDPEDIIGKSLSFFGADTLSTRSEGTSFSHVFNLGDKTMFSAIIGFPQCWSIFQNCNFMCVFGRSSSKKKANLALDKITFCFFVKKRLKKAVLGLKKVFFFRSVLISKIPKPVKPTK